LSRKQAISDSIIVEREDEYESEKILRAEWRKAKREIKKWVEYLVQWKGYPIGDFTFETTNAFDKDNLSLLWEFYKRNSEASRDQHLKLWEQRSGRRLSTKGISIIIFTLLLRAIKCWELNLYFFFGVTSNQVLRAQSLSSFDVTSNQVLRAQSLFFFDVTSNQVLRAQLPLRLSQSFSYIEVLFSRVSHEGSLVVTLQTGF
jgi:hypothetical protein